MQVTGIPHIHSTLNIAWAVMRNDDRESFHWILRQMRVLAERENIRHPMICITDYDRSLRTAWTQHVPLHICVWHVMKNVAHNIRLK